MQVQVLAAKAHPVRRHLLAPAALLTLKICHAIWPLRSVLVMSVALGAAPPQAAQPCSSTQSAGCGRTARQMALPAPGWEGSVEGGVG